MELAVMDPLPLFRLGVLAAVGGGLEFASIVDLAAWLPGARPSVVLLTLSSVDDPGWDLLHDMARHVDMHVVAVLSEYSVAVAARALRAGAVHVVPRGAAAEDMRQVVSQSTSGVLTVSVEILRATVATAPRTSRAQPTDEEMRWLRALGTGTTVAALAEIVRLSERVLYRRLRGLYRKLGVENRTQAVMLARDEGWI